MRNAVPEKFVKPNSEWCNLMAFRSVSGELWGMVSQNNVQNKVQNYAAFKGHMQRMVRNVLQESFRKQDSESCNLVAFQGSVLRYLGYAVLSQKKEKVKKKD